MKIREIDARHPAAWLLTRRGVRRIRRLRGMAAGNKNRTCAFLFSEGCDVIEAMLRFGDADAAFERSALYLRREGYYLLLLPHPRAASRCFAFFAEYARPLRHAALLESWLEECALPLAAGDAFGFLAPYFSE